MSKEDIYKMVRKSDLGFLLGDNWMLHHEFEHFAALVASAERESCAKACEDKAERYAERAAKPEHERDINRDTARIAQQTCFHLADNIRARGQA